MGKLYQLDTVIIGGKGETNNKRRSFGQKRKDCYGRV